MKTLIVSGCSYTWGVFVDGSLSQQKNLAWPELLAKKLEMKCLNLGLCGAGNEYIYSSILDEIIKQKDIGLVIPMWSESQRLDYQDGQGRWQGMHLHFARQTGTELIEPWKNKATDWLVEEGYGDLEKLMERTIRYYYTFQKVMESSGFPYVQLQGTYHFPIGTYLAWNMAMKVPIGTNSLSKILFKSEYLDLIDDTRFIGWPIAKRLGGFSWDSYLDKLDPERVKFRIDRDHGKKDSHPNEEGHELMADLLYREIKQNEIL